MAVSKLDEVVSLAKRRGFVFPAGEIYGGTRSAWDYGPLGVALKDNIKREWWRYMVTTRGDVVGVDTSVILPSQVWVASGHVSVFNDPLIECLNCHKRHRADKLEESYAEKHGDKMPENGLKDIACPDCGTRGNWTEPRDFNMMLRTHLGPVEDENSLHYLRPETAQGIFVDFKNVMTATRQKPPFGIANIGKSFRNEITPGNFIFRTREFEQMEMEFFVEPGTDEAWHQYWIDTRVNWYVDLGVKPENLRMYEHPKEKLSHYSKRTVDIEYKFGFQGSDWGELEGIANRTDYDLSAHAKHSGEDLSYFNQATGEKYVPYVIEPAAGLTRSLMAFLVDAYDVDEAPNTKGGVDKRTVLRLDPRLAPVKAAVLPLSKKPELQAVAQDLAADLRQHDWVIDYDEAGAIGRRYRREDEIGTPLCVTVDFDTLEDHAVTIRERDTMQQERVSLDKVADYVASRINEKRVKYPQGPVEIVGTRAADGGVDVSKENGVDESQPVKIAQAGGLY
ncbi:glycine--tRNA ligase [Gardnerella vaginalis]|uniref:Glycine--tRNA ligase n=1 Tax=Gardnerella vaginalis JCP8108 TaxID=1261066 RepID=S4I2V3_GARVA|nr:glycine--tRNA ligase [Gardnerella vaginalis]EPI48036.1 glycine--tRNA ligase [Gardnerella vaginalis JCP8108]EPI56498.1 glycine--tRNA ligase [Gardnerella vaginalis JCP7275]EPI57172.1 glycine--tRNA ligase [Gardnerella vaginalis JCP7276]MDK7212529.1 glycine--tRNA ligase [Gardnerella vaginalis]MDK7260053.1 glycine--tRNA ligase [Gardnerella vaginalis]